jgi:two-component system LytT family response regulator
MENPLKTIIVDDESLARRGLKHRLKDVGDLEIIAEAGNGREALKLIREHDPDLVFWTSRCREWTLRRAAGPDAGDMPAIVFVTAFDDYAIKAFEAHALTTCSGRSRTAGWPRPWTVRENRERKHALEHRKSLLELVSQITGSRCAACANSRRGSTS